MNFRLAFRRLAVSPGHTAAAVGTLALVIGATSAIFGAVYGVLLEPLPIREPDDLVICWDSDVQRDVKVVEVSYRTFEGWRARARSFSQTAAVGSSTWPAVLHAPDRSIRLASAGVSVSFFGTLGVPPALGRDFRAEDDAPGSPRVAILSHHAWVTFFGSNENIVGTTVTLDEPMTIVGVMPADVDFPRGTDFWTPVVPVLASSGAGWRTDALKNVGVLFLVGRLRPGVTTAAAAAELDRVAHDLERDGEISRFGTGIVATSFMSYVVGPARAVLWALFAAVIVLLTVGCSNISGLMLTRVSERRRDGRSGATRRRRCDRAVPRRPRGLQHRRLHLESPRRPAESTRLDSGYRCCQSRRGVPLARGRVGRPPEREHRRIHPGRKTKEEMRARGKYWGFPRRTSDSAITDGRKR